MALAACVLGILVPRCAWGELAEDTVLGPGLRRTPAYDGSGAYRVEPVAIVRYLASPWFLRSTQGFLEGGARVALAPHLHLGAQLAYEDGRERNYAQFLVTHHLPDIRPGASGGIHLEWDAMLGPMPINVLLRARQFLRAGQGAQFDFRTSAGVAKYGRFQAGVFTQVTWQDGQAARAVYGITPASSAISGLPPYAATSGCLYESLGLLWSVDLSRRWALAGDFEDRQLRGSAEGSPIAEQGTSRYIDAGITYRF